ncbi:hypothetical protein BC830DRAFT_1069097 [Chytriomyces sp. MP71]|nr:hypothetical protein BC830DRAFT_1069097 [Chytriomyces sp. MP71]
MRVRRWTKQLDIFQKKFLLVPINENLHWYLAVVWNPGAFLKPAVGDEKVETVHCSPNRGAAAAAAAENECRVLIFDSLAGRHPQVGKTLAAYLKKEAQAKLGREARDVSALKMVYAKVQPQLNFCDCGVFLLHYLNFMCRDPARVVKAVLVWLFSLFFERPKSDPLFSFFWDKTSLRRIWRCRSLERCLRFGICGPSCATRLKSSNTWQKKYSMGFLVFD